MTISVIPEIWGKIKNLNLETVRRRLIVKIGFTPEKANEAIASYRQFLYCCVTVHSVSPDALTDEVWHAHLLHTRQYAEDCMHIAGRMIHHEPTTITDEELVEATLLQSVVLPENLICSTNNDGDQRCENPKKKSLTMKICGTDELESEKPEVLKIALAQCSGTTNCQDPSCEAGCGNCQTRVESKPVFFKELTKVLVFS